MSEYQEKKKELKRLQALSIETGMPIITAVQKNVDDDKVFHIKKDRTPYHGRITLTCDDDEETKKQPDPLLALLAACGLAFMLLCLLAALIKGIE